MSDGDRDYLVTKDILEAWKKVVDVQQHFNTIEMTIRNIYATLMIAIIAGMGIAIKEDIYISIGISWFMISLPSIFALSLVAAALSILFWFVDHLWYHKLLLGAVLEGARLEKELSKRSEIDIALTRSIGNTSPVKVGNKTWWILKWIVSDKRFKEEKMMHSDAKIEIFYWAPVCVFVALSVICLAFSRISTSSWPIEVWSQFETVGW